MIAEILVAAVGAFGLSKLIKPAKPRGRERALIGRIIRQVNGVWQDDDGLIAEWQVWRSSITKKWEGSHQAYGPNGHRLEYAEIGTRAQTADTILTVLAQEGVILPDDGIVIDFGDTVDATAIIKPDPAAPGQWRWRFVSPRGEISKTSSSRALAMLASIKYAKGIGR